MLDTQLYPNDSSTADAKNNDSFNGDEDGKGNFRRGAIRS